MLKFASHRILVFSPLAIFAFMAFGCVFLETTSFTDGKTFPKWLCFWGGIPLFVFSWFCLRENKKVAERIFKLIMPFVISVACVLQAVCATFDNKLHNSSNVSVEMGSFDNVSGYVCCVSFGLPFVFLLGSYDKKWLKVSSWIASLIILHSLYLSYSRTAYIGVLVMAWCAINSKICNQKKVFLLLVSSITVLELIFWLGFTPEFKNNSMMGRILIWNVAITMFLDKPFWGFGIGGVEKYYMYYQARYLTNNQNEDYAFVADNVKNLFNEYLTILVNYGIVGFLLLGIILTFCVKYLFSFNDKLKQACLVTLIGIATMSTFTYTLSYPFSWLLIGVCFYFLIDFSKLHQLRFRLKGVLEKITRIVLFLLVTFYYYAFCTRTRAELLWCQVYKQQMEASREENIRTYQGLMCHLKYSPYFLYNFAYELSAANDYGYSQKIAAICQEYWADYDLELLMAINASRLGNLKSALLHFDTASKMCPNRFVPIYHTYKIYKRMNNIKLARTYALRLCTMSIKIRTNSVLNMKREAKAFLKTIKNAN